MLEFYNLFLYGTKAASSDSVQTTGLHLAEVKGLFYKKKYTVSAAQTALVRNACLPSLLWCVHGHLESCC